MSMNISSQTKEKQLKNYLMQTSNEKDINHINTSNNKFYYVLKKPKLESAKNSSSNAHYKLIPNTNTTLSKSRDMTKSLVLNKKLQTENSSSRYNNRTVQCSKEIDSMNKENQVNYSDLNTELRDNYSTYRTKPPKGRYFIKLIYK